MSERRRFTLLDMMIVVAAMAVSLWLRPEHLLPGFERALEELIRQPSFRLLTYSTRLMLNGDPKLFGPFSIHPMVAVWTLALLSLELLHFRPPLRRLARQPGFAACCAVALAIVLAGSVNFVMLEHRPAPSAPIWIRVHAYLELTLTFSQGQCGAAVASAWLTLALTGRWRPRPDWLDRAGRALGIFWIAIIPLLWFRSLSFLVAAQLRTLAVTETGQWGLNCDLQRDEEAWEPDEHTRGATRGMDAEQGRGAVRVQRSQKALRL